MGGRMAGCPPVIYAAGLSISDEVPLTSIYRPYTTFTFTFTTVPSYDLVCPQTPDRVHGNAVMHRVV